MSIVYEHSGLDDSEDEDDEGVTIPDESNAELSGNPRRVFTVVLVISLLVMAGIYTHSPRGYAYPPAPLPAAPQRSLNIPAINNKTLVIVIGQARGSEYAWRSLYWNLLRPYNADLATFFTSSSPRTVLQSMAKYNWMMPEFPNWSVLFEQIAAMCPMGPQDQSWQMLCGQGGHERQWLGGVATAQCAHPGSAGILLGMRWAVQQKLLELKLDQLYDSFILTRADEVYLCPHFPLSQMDANYSWFPEGEEYGGVSDRHYFAHRELFMRSLNITQELVCNYRHYSEKLAAIKGPNLEVVIAMVFSETNVPTAKFKRSMFTVKLPTDPTRWATGQDIEDGKPFGLLIKYPGELWHSKEHCGIKDIRSTLRGFAEVPL